MITLSHDAFDRTSLVRETVTPRNGVTCAQCGSLSKKGKLYRYTYISDDKLARHRAVSWSKPFCSVCCMRAYHA